ncbi:hypothetical protein BDD21_2659 [Thiocapsa rosea]|uniref:Uncharacterized protein n=2 Tax=Thiocapsa rosea TaxID=69360 RepID=A0A495V9U7_9GAMM|nr:hypothetical protein BDD21_2659 [Thiocapsa rosea]
MKFLNPEIYLQILQTLEIKSAESPHLDNPSFGEMLRRLVKSLLVKTIKPEESGPVVVIYIGERRKTSDYLKAVQMALGANVKSIIFDDADLTAERPSLASLLRLVKRLRIIFHILSLYDPVSFESGRDVCSPVTEYFLRFEKTSKIIGLIEFVRALDAAEFHSLIPLTDTSIILNCYFINSRLPTYNYDWGVSIEAFPELMRKSTSFAKSRSLCLNKSSTERIIGNPIETWRGNRLNASGRISSLVILDWGLSKSISYELYCTMISLSIEVYEILNQKLQGSVKLSFKKRGNSLSDSDLRKLLPGEVEIIPVEKRLGDIFTTTSIVGMHYASTAKFEMAANRVPQIDLVLLFAACSAKPSVEKRVISPYCELEIGLRPQSLDEIRRSDISSLVGLMLQDKSEITYDINECAEMIRIALPSR